MTGGRVAVALALTWLAVAFLLAPRHGTLLTRDEVDYAQAARQGLVANWLEEGGLSLPAFLGFVQARLDDAPVVFPEGYDEATDPLNLRHLHPPLLTYMLVPFSGAQSERVLRLVLLVGVLMLLVTLHMAFGPAFGRGGGPEGARDGEAPDRARDRAAPDRARDGWSFALMLLMGAWAALHGFSTLHMHGLMAVTALLATALFLRWLEEPGRGWPVLPALGLALTALTLETAVLIWGGLLALALFWPSTQGGDADRTIRVRLRAVFPVFALALGLVAVFWLGGLVKASPLRTVTSYAYRIYLGGEYALVSARLPGIARAALPFLLLAGMAMGARIVTRIRLSWRSRAFLLVGVVYGVVMVPVALSETYLIPAAVLLTVPSLAALAHVKGRAARASILLAIVIALAASSPPVGAGDADARLRDDYEWLAGDGRLEGRVLWADVGHILDWYFPDAQVRLITVSYDGTSLTERRQGRYRPLSEADIGHDLVLVEGSRGGQSLERSRGPLMGCVRSPRPSFVLYDCGRRSVR